MSCGVEQPRTEFRIIKGRPKQCTEERVLRGGQEVVHWLQLHLLTSEHGVFQDMQITPGNVHDVNFLKDTHFEEYTKGKTLLGDRGYIS